MRRSVRRGDRASRAEVAAAATHLRFAAARLRRAGLVPRRSRWVFPRPALSVRPSPWPQEEGGDRNDQHQSRRSRLPIARLVCAIAIAGEPARWRRSLHRRAAASAARASSISARIESGRSCGRGCSIRLSSGRSSAGYRAQIGDALPGSNDARRLVPISSRLPNPIAAAASRSPRL